MDGARHHVGRVVLALAAGNARSLDVITSTTGVAALLPLIDGGFIVLFLSFVLFCSTFLVVVVSTTYIVRLARKPEE